MRLIWRRCCLEEVGGLVEVGGIDDVNEDAGLEGMDEYTGLEGVDEDAGLEGVEARN